VAPVSLLLLPVSDELCSDDDWLLLLCDGLELDDSVPLPDEVDPQAASTMPATATPTRSRKLLARRTLFS